MHRRAQTSIGAAALAVFVLAAGACGGSDKSGSGDKATTTSTTASTSTTSTTVLLTTDSKVAAALDGTILTAAEVQSALALPAPPQPFTGTGAAPPPPQGPLSLDGVAKVFPDPAYKGLLEQGEASVGANKTYAAAIGAGAVINVLAVKFKDATTGGTFVQSATQVATTFGGAKTNAHPEVKIGVVPAAVLVVPPAPGAQAETVVIATLYQDGVYYQVSSSAAPGSVKDEVVLKLLAAQDAKYQRTKASIPAS
ncbi:MAG: hypothetical protein QOK43_1096 [Acidimicrobiaceae bacterium]|nr:hypothetical protein [Acidimicrobiaceae bacterium]